MGEMAVGWVINNVSHGGLRALKCLEAFKENIKLIKFYFRIAILNT